MKWSLKKIAEWTNAQIISEFETNFDVVGTDTRQDLSGQIFIALKGDSFDAHNYLEQAVEKGAKALLIDQLPDKFEHLKSKVTILKCSDTLKALQSFANGYRRSLSAQVIGITGSNGKTTTKEFTAQIIGTYKKTHYSKGSFNNHWGVPLTILSAPTETEVLVVEMGMNHAGEITELVKIAEPDVVVCTMVGTAHIEFFKTQQNIAKAKSEIYMESKPETIRIFNQDQDLTFDMMYPVAKKFPESRMLSFSEKNHEADIYFKIQELKMKEMKISGSIAAVEGHATVPIFGKQNLTNLMAAATLAYVCKISPEKIWQTLPKCQTSWGRNQFIETKKQAEILFDGYNANPDSMKALLENIPLLKCDGKKIGIFGQMKELGEASQEAHAEIGHIAGQCDFSQIYFIGEDHTFFEKGIQQSGFKGKIFIKSGFSEDLGQQLAVSLEAGDILIIKGSRGAHTERFISYCQPVDWQEKY